MVCAPVSARVLPFRAARSRGRQGNAGLKASSVQTRTSFCTDFPPVTACWTRGQLRAALTASRSHSLHRPAETVVSDGALPAGGGVQSAPRSVRMELQWRTQSQNYQGIQGRPLHPSLLQPPSRGVGRGGGYGSWGGAGVLGDPCPKVRSVNYVGTCLQSLWTVSTLGTGVRASGFEI